MIVLSMLSFMRVFVLCFHWSVAPPSMNRSAYMSFGSMLHRGMVPPFCTGENTCKQELTCFFFFKRVFFVKKNLIFFIVTIYTTTCTVCTTVYRSFLRQHTFFVKFLFYFVISWIGCEVRPACRLICVRTRKYLRVYTEMQHIPEIVTDLACQKRDGFGKSELHGTDWYGA